MRRGSSFRCAELRRGRQQTCTINKRQGGSVWEAAKGHEGEWAAWGSNNQAAHSAGLEGLAIARPSSMQDNIRLGIEDKSGVRTFMHTGRE